MIVKRNLFLTILAAVLFLGSVSAQEPSGLPRGEVSQQWSGAAAAFYEDAASVLPPAVAQPLSIMVVDNGNVVFEEWYNGHKPEKTKDVYSVSKSVLALAVGCAVEEGLFGVEDRVIDFFPDQLPENVSEILSSMRIRHLLTMTCGLEESPKLLSVFKGDAAFDWIREFFASPQTFMPGTDFYYNLFSSYIMAAILQKTSGMSVMDYIRPRLLEPLHITDMEWESSPAGICVGGWGMHLCTEDMAKLGQLLLQHGKWNGRQLVPSGWVDTMTSKLVESKDRSALNANVDPAIPADPDNDHSKGYGYYVWQCKHGIYRMEGISGNFTFVDPSRGIVLVVTSVTKKMDQKYLDLIWKHFGQLI